MPQQPAESSLKADDAGSANDFLIVCSCGQSHSGHRRRRHQQLICKGCGTALFVLPADVYPAPAETGSKKGSKKKRRKRKEASRSRVGAAVGRFHSAVVGRVRRTARSMLAMLRWVFAPVRLAIYAVLLVVGLTGWYVSHQRAVAQAEIDIVTEAKLGFDALESRNFEVANDHLTRAANAVAVLQRTDEQARRLVQASREAAVLSRLASSSILALLNDIDEAGVDDANEWKLTQQVAFRDQWVAFDATLEKREGQVAIVLPLRLGQEKRSVVIRANADVMDALPFENETPKVIFAGQIETVRRTPKAWDVILDAETLFLWESPELYAELGFVLDDIWNTEASMRTRLERQRLWQGGELLPDDVDAGSGRMDSSSTEDAEGDQ